MGGDQSHVTESIFKLTLEMIYLITGKNVTTGKSGDVDSIIVPLHFSVTPEKTNRRKILEATKKITELLTGEVPSMSQDVTVHLSLEEWPYLEEPSELHKESMTEEWPYLEGHKEAKMEDQAPLTLPDGSRNNNPPQRSPHPLYSRNSTQEGLTFPHHGQSHLVGEEPGGAMMMMLKEEEIPLEIDSYGSRNNNPPQRSPHPLYSWNSTQEGLTTPHHGQSHLVGEEPGEAMMVKEEEIPLEIDSSGAYTRPSEYHQTSAVNCKLEGDDIIQAHLGENTFTPKNPSHREGEVFPCLECGKCFSRKGSLVSHRRLHTGESLVSCSDCGKKFPEKSLLIKHQRTHTGEKPFSCDVCNRRFTRKSTLIQHERLHRGEKPFACSYCGRCFTLKRNMTVHERSHTGEKPFQCQECGKCFTRKNHLMQHQWLHQGEKPFKCAECGKCFTVKSRFLLHERTHAGEKPFQCLECGKSFTRKTHLTQHELLHRGEKPFQCPESMKCFTVKPRLIVHLQTHLREKPYQCYECGKCFKKKSSLIKHKAVHQGDKPFTCNECGKSYKWRADLLEHEESHGTKTLLECG